MSVDQAANRVSARNAQATRGRGPAVAVAAALAGSGWVVAVEVAGIPLNVREVYEGAPGEMRWAVVLVASPVSGLAAWLLLAALGRFTAKGSRICVATAVVIVVASFSETLSAASPPGAMLVLILVQEGVAAVHIAGITRRGAVSS